MAQIRLIGTDPSQVPTNGMLGNLAFQNAESVSLEKLAVTGNVGIGTSSPNDVLDIAAGNYGGITIKCGTTVHRPTLSFFNTTDSLAAYIQATGNSLAFGSMNIDYGGHTPRMTLTSTGLGIGSTGPLAKLDVISSTLPQVYFSSSEADNTTKYLSIASRQYSSVAEPEGVSVIAAECSAGDNVIHIGGYLGELNAASVIRLYTANNLTTRSGTERLRITSTGTVNIVGAGTAGSTQAVSFSGSAPVNSLVLDSSGRVGIGINIPEATLDISNSIKIRGQRKSYYFDGQPPGYPASLQDRLVELTSKFSPSAGTDVLINNTGGVQGDWQVDVVISGDDNGPGVGVSRLTCRFQSRYNHGAGAIDLLNIQVIDKTIVSGTYYSTIPVNIAVTMSGNNIMLTIGGSTSYTTGIVNVKWMGSGTSSGSPTSLTLPGTTTSSSWVTETAWSTDKVTGNNILIAKTGNNERLRITSTGALNLVGAGTAGSTQAVSFSGSAPVNSLVLDSSGRVGLGTSATASYGGQLAIAINGAGDFIVLADNTTTSGAAAPRLGCLGNDLVFKTNSGLAAATERLTINSAGLTTCLKGVQAPMGWYYQNTYTCNSTWGTAWQTVIPNGTISFGTYVVTFYWDYAGAAGAGSPYYLTAATLFTGVPSTNGSGVENEVALLSSTHTGATGAYIRVRTANSPSGTTSLQVNLVNFSVVSGTQFTVYVQRIGY